MSETDEQLITRMGFGDEAALVSLHERYAPYLLALTRRMLRDPALAHECVQDAFMSAWNASSRFDPSRASAKTWLVTITHRRALNALRDQPTPSLPLEDWDGPGMPNDVVEQVAMRCAVDTLDPEECRLVEWAFYHGYSHTELAVMTGKPLGTVKTKLRSALSRLRSYFSEVPRDD